jgi:transcriptional/translational regulatory protein YebC/TACO1
MFEKKGLITVKTEAKSEDELMELAIDAGADDLQTVDEQYEITTAVENFEAVRKALEDAGVAMELAEISRIPQNTVSIDEKKGKALLKLMDILDDHDDIQKAYSNFDISDEVMAAIIENS